MQLVDFVSDYAVNAIVGIVISRAKVACYHKSPLIVELVIQAYAKEPVKQVFIGNSKVLIDSLVAGLSDANADPTETGDSIDSFFSDNDYFYHAELGWVSSFDRRYFDNTHITVWARDADKFGNPDGWGLTFSWAKFIDDRMMPFVRVGHSDGGGGALLENMISAGLGIYRKSHDLFGVGFRENFCSWFR